MTGPFYSWLGDLTAAPRRKEFSMSTLGAATNRRELLCVFNI